MPRSHSHPVSRNCSAYNPRTTLPTHTATFCKTELHQEQGLRSFKQDPPSSHPPTYRPPLELSPSQKKPSFGLAQPTTAGGQGKLLASPRTEPMPTSFVPLTTRQLDASLSTDTSSLLSTNPAAPPPLRSFRASNPTVIFP